MTTKSLPDRSSIPTEQTWDKEKVYSSDTLWQKEFEELTLDLQKIKTYVGKLADAPLYLTEWFELYSALWRKADKLSFYAYMNAQCDANDQISALQVSQITQLSSQLSAATSFAEPEILQIGQEILAKWQKENTALQQYSHYLDKLYENKKHKRSKEVEELFGHLNDPFSASVRVRHSLLNQELDFGSAEDSHKNSHIIAQSTIDSLLSNSDQILRRSAWESYADSHLRYQETLANIYLTSVRQNIFLAKSRGFKSVLEAQLAPNQISSEVFHNLIAVCKKNTHIWERYWDILRKTLALDKISPHDIWAPLTKNPPLVSYQQAIEWICAGMSPLGKEYVETIRQGCLEERWTDYAQNKGKSQGAFSYGTYDTAPYIMMSYDNTLGALSTLAHELGHSMHSYYTNKTQPYIYSSYSMFVAEVASNFNQALVRSYLFDQNNSRDFELSLIAEAMDNIHRYFFIMPTLAQFEFEVYSRMEAGDALNAAELNRIMSDLYKAGYGTTMTDDSKRTGITWAQFSHLFVPFYTFQYATGISAAHSFAKKILEDTPDAVANYLTFLKSGSSQYPLTVLKNAGVDMCGTQAIEDTFLVLSGLVDRLEGLLE